MRSRLAAVYAIVLAVVGAALALLHLL